MNGSDITVVIPAHNAGEFITQTLDGVAGQTVQPKSVIVVNNASSDDTAARVTAWAKEKNLDVRVMDIEFGDLANARNVGFCAADTELIAMLDADDIYCPRFLEMAVSAFELKPELCLFFGNKLLFDDTGPVDEPVLEATRVVSLPREELSDTIYLVRDGMFEALLYGNFVSPSGAVVRRTSAYKARLFTPRLLTGADRDFFCRLSLQGPAAYTLEPVTRYRLHGESMMKSTGKLRLQKNIYRGLTVMLMDADFLQFDETRIRAVKAALDHSADIILYQASLNGLQSYLAERKWLSRMRRPPFTAKSYLRGLYKSMTSKGA